MWKGTYGIYAKPILDCVYTSSQLKVWLIQIFFILVWGRTKKKCSLRTLVIIWTNYTTARPTNLSLSIEWHRYLQINSQIWCIIIFNLTIRNIWLWHPLSCSSITEIPSRLDKNKTWKVTANRNPQGRGHM